MLSSISGEAFLVPGRHPCKWVGNGDEYRLVGNCMDCGKILSNQVGDFTSYFRFAETQSPTGGKRSLPSMWI